MENVLNINLWAGDTPVPASAFGTGNLSGSLGSLHFSFEKHNVLKIHFSINVAVSRCSKGTILSHLKSSLSLMRLHKKYTFILMCALLAVMQSSPALI